MFFMNKFLIKYLILLVIGLSVGKTLAIWSEYGLFELERKLDSKYPSSYSYEDRYYENNDYRYEKQKDIDLENITIDDLYTAYFSSNTLNAAEQISMYHYIPLVGCVSMFVQALEQPYNNQSISRLRKVYQLFYYNCKSGDIFTYPRFIFKTDTLNKTTRALMIGLKEPIPLTIDLLDAQMLEYYNNVKTCNTINITNFFKQDLLECLHYINLDEVKVLKYRIYNEIKRINNSTSKSLSNLDMDNWRAYFTKGMFMQGWNINDNNQKLVHTVGIGYENYNTTKFKFYDNNLYNLYIGK